MTRPAVVAPIASATSTDQLKDLLNSVNISLDQESLHELSMAGVGSPSTQAN